MSNDFTHIEAMLKYKEKEKGVAAMMFLFFAPFGVHRFYLGQWIQGILFTVIFWAGVVCSILLFFENMEASLKIMAAIIIISLVEAMLLPSNLRKANKKIIKKREKFLKEAKKE